MAQTNKITIRVIPSSKKQTIRATTVGRWGDVALNDLKIELPGSTLVVPTDSNQYWRDILTTVLAAIPTT